MAKRDEKLRSSHDDDEDPFEWETRNSSTPFVQHALAGSCAGVMEHMSMYPLDTVKTHMQASPVRLGMCEAAGAVVRTQGALGLMRGCSAIGVGCVPAHVGFFGTYEFAREKLVGEHGEQQPMRMAACGAAATIVHDTILTPHDVVKQRLQLGRHLGPLECASFMWRHEGFRGFYRSLPVTLAMNIPFMGALVVCNDSLQRFFAVSRGSSAEAELRHAPWYFFCAGISGAIAGALTTPFDVVKTQLQTQTGKHPSEGSLRMLRRVILHSSWSGMMTGVGPRVLIAAPSAAVSWGTYETVSTVLRDLHAAKDAGGDRETKTHQARATGSKLPGGMERTGLSGGRVDAAEGPLLGIQGKLLL